MILIGDFTLKLLGQPTPLLHALNRAITATKAKSLSTMRDLRLFMCVMFKFLTVSILKLVLFLFQCPVFRILLRVYTGIIILISQVLYFKYSKIDEKISEVLHHFSL